MTTWETIILTIGGNAAILAIIGWLGRSLLSQFFAKDLEKHKMSLTAASNAETEELKHRLQLIAQEKQVVISKLHERRAQVIAEVYGLLTEAQWAFHGFVSPAEFQGDPTKKEKYGAAMTKAAEFYRYFDKNRIYLPVELCDQLDTFFRDMRSKVIGFGVYLHYDDKHLDDESIGNKMKAWIDAAQYFDQEVPRARSALESELRRIIGVASAG